MILAAQGKRVQLTQSAVHEMFLGTRAALLEVFCGGMELTLGARSLSDCAFQTESIRHFPLVIGRGTCSYLKIRPGAVN